MAAISVPALASALGAELAGVDPARPVSTADLATIRAAHDLDWSRRRSGARWQMTQAQKRAVPAVAHPVVRYDSERRVIRRTTTLDDGPSLSTGG